MNATRETSTDRPTVSVGTWIAFDVALTVLLTMIGVVGYVFVANPSLTLISTAVAFFLFATNSRAFSRALRGPFVTPEPEPVPVTDRKPLFELVG